jgi:hypothetical protein
VPVKAGDWVSAQPASPRWNLSKVVGPLVIDRNEDEGFDIYSISVLDRTGYAIPVEVKEETLQPADGETRTVVK